jgi:hypothetical protein
LRRAAALVRYSAQVVPVVMERLEVDELEAIVTVVS